ncbi:MAG: WD40 repeat domain-containing protein [Bacteroidota bacterium]
MSRFSSLLIFCALFWGSLSANDSDSTYRHRTIDLGRSAFALDYSAGGNLLAVAGQGAEVELLLPLLGKSLKKLTGAHEDDVLALSFSPQDRLLASAGVDGKVVIWDVASARPLRIMEGHKDYVIAVSWMPDGETLASASWDGKVIYWEPGTGKKIQESERHSDKLTGFAFSPDGKKYACSSADGMVHIFDAETMERIKSLEGHKDDVTNVKWSARSGLLASCGWDNVSHIWNSKTGNQINRLEGHKSDVNCISFSPDGTILATSGSDRKLKIWDLPTGREIANITDHAHDADVEDIDFNNNGTQLATCSRDGKVKIWRVPSLEARLNAAIKTNMEDWKKRGMYEKTAEYEKRMKRSIRKAEDIRKELESQLALFYETNVNWREGLTFRTYNADGEYFPLTSSLFGSLKVIVSTDDAPRVAEHLDKFEFRDLNLRVKNGRMILRRFTAHSKETKRNYRVEVL